MYATTNLFGTVLGRAVLGLSLSLGGVSEPALVQQSELLFTLCGHSEAVHQVRFSADGKRLATAGDDAVAILWDAATGKKVYTLKGHINAVWGLDFNKDGSR